jgi:hypothetical protein
VSVIDGFPLAAAIARADVAWWMLGHATARDAASPVRTPIITGGR